MRFIARLRINRLRVDFSNRVGDHVEVDCIRQVGAVPRPTPVWDYRFDTGASQGWDTWHDIANLSFELCRGADGRHGQRR
jgi:hypothetical protein